jgi:hypothetical protein
MAFSHAEATDFHFYTETFDDEAVFLELIGGCAAGFEAGPNRVVVRIPIEIWEVIRQRGAAYTDWADMSDDEVIAKRAKDAERRGVFLPTIEEYLSSRDKDRDRRRRIDELEEEQGKR